MIQRAESFCVDAFDLAYRVLLCMMLLLQMHRRLTDGREFRRRMMEFQVPKMECRNQLITQLLGYEIRSEGFVVAVARAC